MINIQQNRISLIHQNPATCRVVRGSVSMNNETPKESSVQVPLNSLKAYHLNSRQVSFGSLTRVGANGFPLDTTFFRELDVSKFVAKYLLDKYPNGTTILKLAASNSEGAITLRMLLDSLKYRIVALDTDPDAIRLARNGIHTTFRNAEEGFLYRSNSELNEDQKTLKNKFFEYFSETERPKEPINNSWVYRQLCADPRVRVEEKFFKLNDSAKDIVEIRDSDEGDILKISQFEPETDVRAIFSRNGFYHLSHNNILNLEKGLRPSRNVDLDVLNKAAEELYLRSGDDGLVSVGKYIGEHVYEAPEYLSDSKAIKLTDTSFYDKSKMSQFSKMKFYKKSPLQTAMERDGKFEPIYWGAVERLPEMQVPLVYKKCS